MAKQTINIGASPNDGTGTPLRTAFDYTNQNFTELYTATGPSGNNIVVPGTATITGNLTVDTTTLFVNSSNDRVGIGTASPAQKLSLVGDTFVASPFNGAAYGDGAAERLRIGYKDGSPDTGLVPAQIVAQASVLQIATRDIANGTLTFHTGTGVAERYRIDGIGVSTWSISGSTAMTLNASGLGVGVVAAAAKLQAAASALASVPAAGATGHMLAIGSSPYGIAAGALTNGNSYIQATRWDGTATNYDLLIQPNGGNVGIGVAPSAWTPSDRALQFAYGNSIATATSTNFSIARNAQELAGGWTYSANGFVQLYNLESDGGYKWYTATSGIAGNPVSFGSAKMTLDTLGNLILLSPSTPPTLATNGQLTVNATSNTNLRFSYRGSDGTTRVANITLA